MEYATKLKAYADTAADDLLIVMRVYFEKWVSRHRIYVCTLTYVLDHEQRSDGKASSMV